MLVKDYSVPMHYRALSYKGLQLIQIDCKSANQSETYHNLCLMHLIAIYIHLMFICDRFGSLRLFVRLAQVKKLQVQCKTLSEQLSEN